MVSLVVVVLLGLALGSLVVPLQGVRIKYKKTTSFSSKPLQENRYKKISTRKPVQENQYFSSKTAAKIKCCKIIAGTVYDSKTDADVSVQGKRCKQHKTSGKGDIEQSDFCDTARYMSAPYLDLTEVETLKTWECRNSPWCGAITLPKCYRITEGELSPPPLFWHTRTSQNIQRSWPPGMALSVAGKICQRSESKTPTTTYTHGPRFAKLEIKAVEMLGNEECEGDKWKHYGLEAAPECDDFGFWKQVLSTEGIKAPNWEASIAAAKSLSPEGMAWGTAMVKGAADDSLWNARRDTVLQTDDPSSSWS